MGNATFGIPEDLALSLKEAIKAKTLVETGTYKGGTALWASKNFEKVYTIEFDEQRYLKTLGDFKTKELDIRNVEFCLGNSKYILPSILEDLKEPVVFWLDAHGTFVLEKPQTEDD